MTQQLRRSTCIMGRNSQVTVSGYRTSILVQEHFLFLEFTLSSVREREKSTRLKRTTMILRSVSSTSSPTASVLDLTLSCPSHDCTMGSNPQQLSRTRDFTRSTVVIVGAGISGKLQVTPIHQLILTCARNVHGHRSHEAQQMP